ncbi:Uncharacterised protein [Mycobacteroides abscessus subsp. massiliense]|nr:Uncharacterised protein [Mycobacteroides abscessus subsp. massiliense]
MVHVGLQRTGAGDVHGEPIRQLVAVLGPVRLELFDDVSGGLGGFVGQCLAHVSREVHLNVGGLAVGALRTGLGQRITPEILNVLNVFGVGTQTRHHLVVELVGARAQSFLPFEHDHDHAVGVRLLEHLAHVLHRLHRRRTLRAQRDRMLLAHLLQLRNEGIQGKDDGQPADDDGDRQAADPFGQEGGFGRRTSCVRPAHADFTKQ